MLINYIMYTCKLDMIMHVFIKLCFVTNRYATGTHFPQIRQYAISWWISQKSNLNLRRWILISHIWKSISWAWTLSHFFENGFWKSCLHANKFRSYAFHFLKCVNNFHAYEIGYPVTEIENPIYEMIIPVNEIDFKNMNSELTWMHTNIKLFK